MSISPRGRPRELEDEPDLAADRPDSTEPERSPARHRQPAPRHRQALPPVAVPPLNIAGEERATGLLDELARETSQLFRRRPPPPQDDP